MSILWSLALVFSAAAAEPRRCPDGSAPGLTGDALVHLECPSQRRASPTPPDWPEAVAASAPFSQLAGKWNGSFTRGTGRYAVTATVKRTTAGAEVRVETKELQMRTTSSVVLAFTLEKPGRYKLRLSSPDAPKALLRGTAVFGKPGSHQADIRFDNGAAHRLVFALPAGGGPLALEVRSALPGAPVLSYAVTLDRAAR